MTARTATRKRSAKAAQRDRTQGTIYLLHFERPYKHARHYIGFAQDLQRRLDEHACGAGARLLRVVRDAGIGWQLARTWPGTRSVERALKNKGGAGRMCPCCGVAPVRVRYEGSAATNTLQA